MEPGGDGACATARGIRFGARNETDVVDTINNLWVLIAALLVFLAGLGLVVLEATVHNKE